MKEMDLELDFEFGLGLKENDERCLDLEGVGVRVDDEYGKGELVLGLEVTVVRGGREIRCGRCWWWWKSVMVEKESKKNQYSESVCFSAV